jgi:hypothetical protein
MDQRTAQPSQVISVFDGRGVADATEGGWSGLDPE